MCGRCRLPTGILIAVVVVVVVVTTTACWCVAGCAFATHQNRVVLYDGATSSQPDE